MKMILLLFSTVLIAQTVNKQSPLACDRMALSAEQRRRHFDEVGPLLRGLVRSVRELPGGYEFLFPADDATFRLLSEYVEGERLCCPFFDLDIHQEREHGSLSLRLQGRDGVKEFIRADFAKWMKHE